MNQNDVLAILQKLVGRGTISATKQQELQEKVLVRDANLLKLLGEENIASEEEVTRIFAEITGLPYISLFDKKIPAEVLNVLPAEAAQNYQVVPFAKEGKEVSMAMVNPQNLKAIEAVEFISRQGGYHISYFIASPSGVAAVMRQYADLNREIAQALAAKDEGLDLDLEEQVEKSEEKVESAPVSKMVAVILRYAVEGHASDVHIEPAEEESRVRYRVDGVLHTSLKIPKAVHDAVIARIKVLANLKLDETRLPQDGRFRREIDGREIDFRVSTMPLLNKEKVVLRILDKSLGIMSLEKLGFFDRNKKVIEENIHQPHGMILLTGPTGCGKTTTLYSLLQILNEEDRNIVTLEDPVEYNIPGVSQSPVRPEIGLTFARGLRFILRQDPDIIMVGEIRDNETAELAIHAALTGHMVLSTLHTNSAIGAVARLIDMKVEPFLIASALKAVVAQRLVRKICPACRKPKDVPENIKQNIRRELKNIPATSLPEDIKKMDELTFFAGAGCEKCNKEGFHGRLAISEVIEINPILQEIIGQGKAHDFKLVNEELQRQAMVSMKQDGIIKALRGFTTLEEVLAATEE